MEFVYKYKLGDYRRCKINIASIRVIFAVEGEMHIGRSVAYSTKGEIGCGI